jgi:two-component system, OmpR family, response regulator VicR
MTKMRLDPEQESCNDFGGLWYPEPMQHGVEQRDGFSRTRHSGRGLELRRPPDERLTVLVVEDEVSIAAVIAEVLAEAGYRTLSARNGRTALAIIRRERPALVLTDRMMPELDGVEFVRRLRASPITYTIPVVMMSSTPPSREDMGDIPFLAKPFDLDDLLALVGALAECPINHQG